MFTTSTSDARVAVVTGAGTGIGRATARCFLAAGWRTVLAGRTERTLLEAARFHERALIVPTDVTDEKSVANLFTVIAQAFGRVDAVFNNAGVPGVGGSVDELDPEEFRRTLEVNVTGSMLVAAAAVRMMKAQTPTGGRIINNGSIAAHRPRPRTAAYAVSKHAITGLTRSVALDGREFGISCAQINIGNAATDLLDALGEGAHHLQPDGRRITEPTFDVEIAARTVVFMAETPAGAVMSDVTLTAAGMPWDGRG